METVELVAPDRGQPARGGFFRVHRNAIIMMTLLVGCILAIVLPITLHDYNEDEGQEASEIEFVSTPGGNWPKSCVHEVPSGTRIKSVQNGVERTFPNGTVHTVPPCPIRNGDAIPRGNRNGGRRLLNAVVDTGRKLLQSLPGAHSYPALYFAFTSGSNPFVDFEGYISTPNTPANVASQVLFYWYGLEPSAGNIVIQPVMQFNQVGNPGVWTASSWNCCPYGHKHFSSPVSLSSGDQMYGSMKQLSSGNGYNTISRNERSGESTNLISDDGITYVDALLALETYTVTNCNQLPADNTKFTSFSLAAQSNPNWVNEDQNPYLGTCGGGSSVSGNTMTIVNGGN